MNIGEASQASGVPPKVNQALRHLADRCDGDHRPGYPIIDELATVVPCGTRAAP